MGVRLRVFQTRMVRDLGDEVYFSEGFAEVGDINVFLSDKILEFSVHELWAWMGMR